MPMTMGTYIKSKVVICSRQQSWSGFVWTSSYRTGGWSFEWVFLNLGDSKERSSFYLSETDSISINFQRYKLQFSRNQNCFELPDLLEFTISSSLKKTKQKPFILFWSLPFQCLNWEYPLSSWYNFRWTNYDLEWPKIWWNSWEMQINHGTFAEEFTMRGKMLSKGY